MSTVSVSVAPSVLSNVAKPELAGNGNISYSSDNLFSGVLDSSLQADGSVVCSAENPKPEFPLESADTEPATNTPVETAADMLMTLQISLGMDTSLQVKSPVSIVPDIKSNEAVTSSDVTSETSVGIISDKVSPEGEITLDVTNVNSHIVNNQRPQIKLPNLAEQETIQSEKVATVDAEIASLSEQEASIAPLAPLAPRQQTIKTPDLLSDKQEIKSKNVTTLVQAVEDVLPTTPSLDQSDVDGVSSQKSTKKSDHKQDETTSSVVSEPVFDPALIAIQVEVPAALTPSVGMPASTVPVEVPAALTPLVEVPASTVSVDAPAASTPLVGMPASTVPVEVPAALTPSVGMPASTVPVEVPAALTPSVGMPASTVPVEVPTASMPSVRMPALKVSVEVPAASTPSVGMPASTVSVEVPAALTPSVGMPASTVSVDVPAASMPSVGMPALTVTVEVPAALTPSVGMPASTVPVEVPAALTPSVGMPASTVPVDVPTALTPLVEVPASTVSVDAPAASMPLVDVPASTQPTQVAVINNQINEAIPDNESGTSIDTSPAIAATNVSSAGLPTTDGINKSKSNGSAKPATSDSKATIAIAVKKETTETWLPRDDVKENDVISRDLSGQKQAIDTVDDTFDGQVLEGLPTVPVIEKTDSPMTVTLGVDKDAASVNMLQHENHSVGSTGSSSTTTAAAISEQNQSLRAVTDQLPSLYAKNGQVNEHELAAHVMLMVGEKWQEAELQIEPQGMGKVRIQLQIDQEQQTHVQFMVQHAQTKDALEQSLPRLREILTQSGVQLGQTHVQQQSQNNAGQSWNQQMADNSAAEQQAQRGSSQSGRSFTGTNENESVQTVTISSAEAAGIDFYA